MAEFLLDRFLELRAQLVQFLRHFPTLPHPFPSFSKLGTGSVTGTLGTFESNMSFLADGDGGFL